MTCFAGEVSLINKQLTIKSAIQPPIRFDLAPNAIHFITAKPLCSSFLDGDWVQMYATLTFVANAVLYPMLTNLRAP